LEDSGLEETEKCSGRAGTDQQHAAAIGAG